MRERVVWMSFRGARRVGLGFWWRGYEGRRLAEFSRLWR